MSEANAALRRQVCKGKRKRKGRAGGGGATGGIDKERALDIFKQPAGMDEVYAVAGKPALTRPDPGPNQESNISKQTKRAVGTASVKGGYRGQLPYDDQSLAGGLWRPQRAGAAQHRVAWRHAELDHHMIRFYVNRVLKKSSKVVYRLTAQQKAYVRQFKTAKALCDALKAAADEAAAGSGEAADEDEEDEAEASDRNRLSAAPTAAMSRAGGPSGEDEPAEQDNAGRVQYVPISTLSDEEKVKAWSADCGDIRSAVRGGTTVPVERRDAFSSWITDGYDCGAKKSVGEAEQLRMVLNHSRLLQQEMTAAAKEAVKLAVDVEDLRSRGLEREARARLHAGRMAALAKLQELLAQHPKMFGHDPDRGLPSVLQRQLMSFLPLLLRQAPDSAVALYVWLTVNQGMLPSNRAEHSGCGIGSRAISTTCDEGLGGKAAP
ncbi:hypothetical protein ABPG75_011867 [Micractinium tetrahymenae]